MRKRLLLSVLCLFCASPAFAFHGGGVGSCSSCHVMHESEDGQGVPGVADGLLRGASPSDVCLACHAGDVYGVLGSDPLLPPYELGAGNFVFLQEDELNDGPKGSTPAPGHHAGHSIVAPAYGLFSDRVFTSAPGGTYPSGQLGCTSCHDPHGNGNFRMLHGVGPIQDGLVVFTNPAPLAEGLPLGLAGVSEGAGQHTAYRSGMSAWCANCHGEYHDHSGSSAFDHDYNAGLSGDEADRYNAYDGEAAPAGGWSATAYLPQVPFEDPTAAVSSTAGPGGAARVMCLTCHRAHATSSPHATRWDMRVHLLDDDGRLSGAYVPPNPYPNQAQRQLCLKCHEPDHAFGSNRACAQCHMTSGGGPFNPGY
jgi:hypothetical protein